MNPPIAIPPRTIVVNMNIPSAKEDIPDHPTAIISRMIRKSASDVPSLKRLSPSKIRARRFGAPYSLKSASTATGSVAEISAPKRSVTMNGSGKPKKFEA